MGRGSSKTSGGGGITVTSVVTQGGVTLDLTNTPLVYGAKDSMVTGAERQTLEGQENKRLTAKIEYGLMVDGNGNVIDQEYRGGKGSVSIPYRVNNTPGATLTHNHPRGSGEEGCLGGTFSSADLKNFENYRYKTIRASAAEGTYSLSKTTKFDRTGFTNHAISVNKAAKAKKNAGYKQVENDYYSGKINYSQYKTGRTRVFNEFLIDIHNGLLAGQKQYGYVYTLEAHK